jgi:hypothetical protein
MTTRVSRSAGKKFSIRLDAQLTQPRGKPIGSLALGLGKFRLLLGTLARHFELLHHLVERLEPPTIRADDREVIGSLGRSRD